MATVEGGGKGSAGGPVGSGVGGGEPERSCEGDEYVITVTFEEVEGEEIDYENDQADIVVQQLEADGSETEVQLRGDLNDVRSLVATLVSEGGCVHVDIVPQPETDSIEEPSGATAGAAEPDAIPEPVLP
ncbi:MAG TPA: hypothetical protein VGN84_09770 [Solirubrobacterales bacterium]|nr:hypothetical protein [Solirubrobacterales bacterium]